MSNSSGELFCQYGWTNLSELSDNQDCDIPILGYQGLKLTLITVGGVIFLAEFLVLGLRFSLFKKKPPPAKILILWTTIQNLLIAARPLINLLTGVRAAEQIWLAIFIHLTAASSAGILILYIYIELGIIKRSSMSRVSPLLKLRGLILSLIGGFQALLFLMGPFLNSYLEPRIILLSWTFWFPVIVIDFTLIPYFCFLSWKIYKTVKEMTNPKFKKLGHQILLTGGICTAIGFFTGGVGIYIMIDPQYDWVLFELAWLSDLFFNLAIFIILIKRRARNPIKLSDQT